MTSQSQPTYYSQFEQDKFVEAIFFPHKRQGIFVDIGAYDGVYLSNSLYFEKHKEWKGLCIEPIPYIFEQLVQNRNCTCVQGCVSANPGRAKFLISQGVEVLSSLVDACQPKHLQRIDSEVEKNGGAKQIIEVDCFTFNALLDQHGLYHVDYCSIDTEGTELEILQSIDFNRFDIDVFTVEVNSPALELQKFMLSKGYRYVETLGCDHVYKKFSH